MMESTLKRPSRHRLCVLRRHLKGLTQLQKLADRHGGRRRGVGSASAMVHRARLSRPRGLQRWVGGRPDFCVNRGGQSPGRRFPRPDAGSLPLRASPARTGRSTARSSAPRPGGCCGNAVPPAIPAACHRNNSPGRSKKFTKKETSVAKIRSPKAVRRPLRISERLTWTARIDCGSSDVNRRRLPLAPGAAADSTKGQPSPRKGVLP